MSNANKPAALRAEADAARAAFLGKVAQLRERLNPQTLVNGAVAGAREKSAAIAGQAAGAVQSKPVAAGAAIGLASLFWARRRRRRAKAEETPEYPVSYITTRLPGSAEE